MDREYIEWLSKQRLPMFMIEHLPDGHSDTWHDGQFIGECWRVTQKRPPKVEIIAGGIDRLLPSIQKYFPLLRSTAAEAALRAAIDDLCIRPPGIFAGPMAEELEIQVRMGLTWMGRGR